MVTDLPIDDIIKNHSENKGKRHRSRKCRYQNSVFIRHQSRNKYVFVKIDGQTEKLICICQEKHSEILINGHTYADSRHFKTDIGHTYADSSMLKKILGMEKNEHRKLYMHMSTQFPWNAYKWSLKCR